MTTTYECVLTNSGTCEYFDEDTQKSIPSLECYGCWDDEMSFLKDLLGDWFTDNPTNRWKVSGLPLWNRDVSRSFTARTIDDFVRGITVRGDWTIRLRLKGDTLHAHLSHHDVPMGRSFTITYGSEKGEE